MHRKHGRPQTQLWCVGLMFMAALTVAYVMYVAAAVRNEVIELRPVTQALSATVMDTALTPAAVHRGGGEPREQSWAKQSIIDLGLQDDPTQILEYFWLSHLPLLRNMSFPVGAAVPAAVESASPNSMLQRLPPFCGRRLLSALEVGFSVSTPFFSWSPCHNSEHDGDSYMGGCWMLTVFISVVPGSRIYDEVTFVGRSVGHVMLSAVSQRVNRTTWSLQLGPFYAHHTTAQRSELTVTATWIGPYFLGQRWVLPDRNDNPPLEEKKRKCLALQLLGDCERFGVTVLRSEVPPTPASSSFRTADVLSSTASPPLLCKPEATGLNGYWARLPEDGTTTEERSMLDDFVGLNRLNGSAWRWHGRHCRFHIFSRDDALTCFRRRNVTDVGLFGDSMMVEFVNQFSLLMRAPIRQGKWKRLRYMELVVPEGPLKVRFSRSYTTREGKSVIANPLTILQQLEATKPQVILGNFAVLHWQQNMRSLKDWNDNLVQLRQLLVDARPRPWHGRAYYLGPTLIQMGRTQGLQPTRTQAFFQAAKDTLASPSSAEGFKIFDPFALSVARQESSYDGQHWGCYHTFGGVAQMILHLWLNQFCNTTP